MNLSFILKKLWRVVRYPLLAILLCATYFGALQAYGNFHTVVPGEFYRSAQVNAADIARYKEKYGIRSIINLRGENTGKPWYDAEVEGAKAAGVTHLNFRMSARRELTAEQAKQLIEMMRTAPKPLLIHCKSGADRTGLASALYLAAVEKAPENESEKQLWAMYGHLPLWFIPEQAMDRTFDALKPMLGY